MGPGDREFLLRLLRVTADDDELDPSEFEFAVITAGRGQGALVNYWPWEKGEVLAVPLEDFGSRDLKAGRKFSKYDIRAERFGRDWVAAVRRSDEVTAAPDVDMFARPRREARVSGSGRDGRFRGRTARRGRGCGGSGVGR